MVELSGQRRAQAGAEVSAPAAQQAVQFAHDRLQTPAPVTGRQPAYLLAEPQETLFMDAGARLPHVARDAEPEVLAVPRPADCAFLLVDHQLEFTGDKAADRAFDPFRRLGRPHVDRHVVGVPHETKTPPFQLLVEFVQHDVL